MILARRYIFINKRMIKDKTCGLLAALQSKQHCDRNNAKIENSVASQYPQENSSILLYRRISVKNPWGVS